MTSSKWSFLLWLLAAGILAFASPARAEEPRTDGEISERLLRRLMDRVADELAASSERRAVRLPNLDAAVPGATELVREIGNSLYDRGYEVYDPAGASDDAVAPLALDFELLLADVEYPRDSAGFLGLGRTRTLRRVAVEAEVKLYESDSGRWLWRGRPRMQSEDWIGRSQREALAADRPEWVEGPALQPNPQGASWWERGLAAGLVGGVIILYLDGAQ